MGISTIYGSFAYKYKTHFVVSSYSFVGKYYMKEIIKIQNKLGIHARPAAEFVKLASKFKSKIYISKNGRKVNGKSIMGVMTLAAEYRSEVEITAEGPDAAEALKALVELINNKFYED